MVLSADRPINSLETGPFSSRATRSTYVLKALTFLATLLLLGFGVESLLAGHRGHGSMLLVFGLITIANYILFRFHRRHVLFRSGVVSLMAVFLLTLVWTGGVEKTGPLWFFILPPIAFYVLGLRTGTPIVAVTILTAVIILFGSLEELGRAGYSTVFKVRFLSSIILVSVMSYILELSRQRARSLLVDKMRQLEERRREIRRRNMVMETDLRMAQELQQAMLPKHYPSFPADAKPEKSAIRFYHRYEPAGTVGGDFFHILRLSESSVGVLICDVMGHEVRSALVTAMLRALAETLKPIAEQPGLLMTDINKDIVSMLRQAPDMMFATASYVVVDIEKRIVRFARAGHHEPLLISRKAGDVVRMKGAGDDAQPALGLLEDAEYVTDEYPVEQGDVVLMFTDGLFEIEDENARELGYEGIERIVQASQGLAPALLLDEVVEQARQYSSLKTFVDDVCIVGVEIWP
ncbi:MAG: SpoIIE family protein phosphatase [Verrucomicrobia bacterium]|nr:SpoIIE family protein phosphatase [Verrucomicrobiota bacterium]